MSRKKKTSRYVFVVGREQAGLYESLIEEYLGIERVKVRLDRREGERRKSPRASVRERRQAERRRRPFSGFAVLPGQHEAARG